MGHVLLVYGPRSATYDFGPGHPLTPRRFGPGIDLLAAVGAEPGLAPEPASDEELRACHSARYIETVRGFGADPFGLPAAGIAEGGDVPPFAGMHEAGAMVAGGSIRAMEAILRGDVEHAFHPGGGLHHAMLDRASGFCIYDDPALAIARARRDGLRVLYVDLDVHHGDGVEAIHADDPGVMTVSFHESGRYLFPGTGFPDDLGEGEAAGTVVNVPFTPGSGEAAWLPAVEALVPELAAAFGPDVIVSQHGADSHAWDPLAHLRVTTTAMGAAARMIDRVAHRWGRGRWLATGGGGYDAYRVVPRAWALTWLAGAHREVPNATPEAWRARWASEAARYGQSPLPPMFDDLPNAGAEPDASQLDAEAASNATSRTLRSIVVPALVRAAVEHGWWSPEDAVPAQPAAPTTGVGRPAIVDSVEMQIFKRLTVAPRVVSPSDPAAVHAIVMGALTGQPGVRVTTALEGTLVVGLCVSVSRPDDAATRDLLALGVAPAFRRQGLAGRLLEAHVATLRPGEGTVEATTTVAERDVVEPLDRRLRADIARRVLERAGFTVRSADGPVGRFDPSALRARRSG